MNPTEPLSQQYQQQEFRIWQSVESLRIIVCFKNRESQQAKTILGVFDQLHKKYNRKVSINAQSVQLA